jgi:hypothetical protein
VGGISASKIVLRRGLFSLSVFLAFYSPLHALDRVKARDQGRRLYERITGVVPSDQATKAMTDKVAAGEIEDAAFYAMQDLGFYKLTIKQMFNVLTTRDFNPDLELTDATALAVGLVRDNRSFDQILYGDIFYTAPDDLQNFSGLVFTVDRPPNGKVQITANQSNPLVSPFNIDRGELVFTPTRNNTPVTNLVRPLIFNNLGLNLYRDNFHYSDLESKYTDWPTRLVARSQSSIWPLASTSLGPNVPTNIPAEDISGILTTRQTASEFYSGGTNRRMFRYTMLNYLCQDMPQLFDTSAPDDYVRADVDRRPGGDVNTYLNTCKGCHAGMDGFTPAFAFFDFNNLNNANQLVMNYVTASNSNFSFNNPPMDEPAFTFSTDRNKQFRQANIFSDGFNPIKMQANGNRWVNRWVNGANAKKIGWRIPSEMTAFDKGKGLHQLGKVLAATEAFSACMTKKVFNQVCFRAPTQDEVESLKNMQSGFENGFSEYQSYGSDGKYNMKAVFAKSAALCFGN